MKPLQLILLAVVGLWLAAGCQQTIAPRLSIGGASPDFLLVIVAVLAIGGTRRAGAVLGFFAGFLMGSLAGANLASYVVTRTLAGFLCGWLTSLELEANPFVAGLITLLMTLFAQVLLMFISPPGAILPFLLATIGSAVVNAVLAMPTFALVRRLSGTPGRQSFHMK